MKCYLMPEYENVKSYYNKAVIIQDENKTDLISYNTLVCTIKENKIILNKSVEIELLLSNTTQRHIKEFLKQFYYKSNQAITKKDLLKLMEE